MRREIDIYDDPADHIPQKKQINPKLKKALVYILCALLGALAAFGLIILYDSVFDGASTPEKAIAEYERAALLYDVDNMIEYSSEYNKTVLYGNQKTSNRLLESYLTKAYSENKPKYSESEISFKLISSLEYEKGSKKYEEAMKKYKQKADDAESVEKIAIVRMTVVKGDDETTRNYLAVKCGSRWFFAYAGA
ncbi:MAG: hypothetical protein J6R45_04125 [Clostridia bacterium]|nr:hypothetical protein [Clostridia bacterium]